MYQHRQVRPSAFRPANGCGCSGAMGSDSSGPGLLTAGLLLIGGLFLLTKLGNPFGHKGR